MTIYADDLLLAGNDMESINYMKLELAKTFEMQDLGEAEMCLGLEIERDKTALKV